MGIPGRYMLMKKINDTFKHFTLVFDMLIPNNDYIILQVQVTFATKMSLVEATDFVSTFRRNVTDLMIVWIFPTNLNVVCIIIWKEHLFSKKLHFSFGL